MTQAGEGFIGTMEFARRSIGLAFCRLANIDPASLDEATVAFWYEYSTSIQWLNIASDRLRQYFRAAFPPTRKRKKGKRQKESSYCAPFKEMDPVGKHDGDLKSSLLPILNELQSRQEDRDIIVHRVATLIAKRALETLKQQREHGGPARQYK